MELGNVAEYKAKIEELQSTFEDLVKETDDLQSEIDELEETIKALRLERREADSVIAELEENLTELERVNYKTLHGQQKGEIIERLKRLDLQTLETIDLCYSAHILGFETIHD